MCGIVGILGREPVAGQLVDALKRLEYRGYDSAGVATLENGHLERRRAEGKLQESRGAPRTRAAGRIAGIGHTRWATHGKPTENNAHPHATERVAVVHNGIIENFRELRDELEKEGAKFGTETDTEVVAHLVTEEMKKGKSPVDAVTAALPRLRGAFALAFIFAGEDDLMIGARKGSPLAIGYGDGEMYLGSDAIALAPFTDTISYLEDGDWAVLTPRAASRSSMRNGQPVKRAVIKITARRRSWSTRATIATSWRRKSTSSRKWSATRSRIIIDMANERVALPGKLPFDFKRHRAHVDRRPAAPPIYAGLVAKYWFERFARLPVEIDVASEFRYREAPLRKGDLAIFISQSGETADTLAALRYAKEQGQHVLSVVNVPTSTIARESDVVHADAGRARKSASPRPRPSPASWRCWPAWRSPPARARGELSRGRRSASWCTALIEVPRLMDDGARHSSRRSRSWRAISPRARDVLYLGRGTSYPLALEGALKLKEISYIHAEGYAAGELKHGPIALIDETMPVIVIAPYDRVFEKTVSNMQEVAARGGKIILMTDAKGAAEARDAGGDHDHAAGHGRNSVTPLVYAVPVQLLAYHTAVAHRHRRRPAAQSREIGDGRISVAIRLQLPPQICWQLAAIST